MDQSLQVSIGRFTTLNKKPNNWIMYFAVGYDIAVNEYLTIIEVNSSNVPTGRQILSQVTDKYNTPLQFTNQSYIQINLIKMAFAWTDYSAISTIVGWSSFTEKFLSYQIIGNTMLVQFRLAGTSNSTSVTFTVPNNAAATPTNQYSANRGTNNGTLQSTPGQCIISAGSNIVTVSTTIGGSAWTASGTKIIIGTMIIQI